MRINFALTPVQRADARAALALLQPVGMTLEQAARIALGKKAPTPNVTVAQVATDFLRLKLTEQCRPATFEWYDERIAHVCDAFGERVIDSITRGEFRTWLDQSSKGAASRAATARAARALWRYALQQDPPLVNQVVTDGLEFKAAGNGFDGSKKFLPVAKAKALLENLPPAERSAVAIMLFAGIRPEEVAGEGKDWLRWEHVNAAERIIRIPGEIAKTKQTRILENLPEALWAWLTPGAAEKTVAPVGRRTLIEHGKLAAKLTTWPQDCLRHSFATYAMALLNEPGRISVWLGHNGNPSMLFRHYRGLATKAEAEKFFALRPHP
jgi:integrase